MPTKVSELAKTMKELSLTESRKYFTAFKKIEHCAYSPTFRRHDNSTECPQPPYLSLVRRAPTVEPRAITAQITRINYPTCREPVTVQRFLRRKPITSVFRATPTHVLAQPGYQTLPGRASVSESSINMHRIRNTAPVHSGVPIRRAQPSVCA